MQNNQEIKVIYSNKKKVSCKGTETNSPHPKVFLSLVPKGKVICPYCNITYIDENYKK